MASRTVKRYARTLKREVDMKYAFGVVAVIILALSLAACKGNTSSGPALASLSVTPAQQTIAKGMPQQFTAMGTYTNATIGNVTASVAWSSSNASVATISNVYGSQGRVTPIEVGSTTITATDLATNISASTVLTVSVYPYLTGGAVQGSELILADNVSTFVGVAPGFADGTGANAKFWMPGSITTDGTNLYVADAGNNTIRQIVIATGQVTTLAGTAGVAGSTDGTGAAANFTGPVGIIMYGTNLYVADTGNNTIRQIVITTGQVTTIAGTVGVAGSMNGTGVAASFNSPTGITTDGTNLYVADTGNNTIRQIVIATGQVTTLAGIAGEVGSINGTGVSASFNSPEGITTDGTNLFVADMYNDTIRKIVIATGQVTILAGTGQTVGATDGIGAAARFQNPKGITTDGTNLFVADTYNDTIRQIVIATGQVTTLAGTVEEAGSTDGIGAVANFNWPAGIATDGTNVYVTDTGNDTIRKIVITAGQVTTLAGTANIGSEDGTGATANFWNPVGITTDGTNLFVADASNNTIRQIVIATGQVTTIAGTAGATGSADGTGAAATFYEPNGITTDGTNLYVTDTGNNTIRQIVIATGQVTTFAGTAGVQGSGDYTGAAASFWSPLGITTDGINLYVTDSGNDTIRQIVIATGQVTTLAGIAGRVGTAGSSLSSDGTGSLARFYGPYGITTDGENLYVADSGNDTIRQIIITTGQVTTLAGTPTVAGFTDGKSSVAKFHNPRGITSDGTNLYVMDTVNDAIRQIIIATKQVTTIAGAAKGYMDGTGVAARFNWPEGVTTDGTSLYISDTANNTIRRVQ
jgi:DNA-binding beta-propeller fold protein YncE